MTAPALLLRRGRRLEAATLAWNVIGVVVLALAARAVRSVALVGFGLDSLIEIGASTVVLWELAGTGLDRQRKALRLIGGGSSPSPATSPSSAPSSSSAATTPATAPSASRGQPPPALS